MSIENHVVSLEIAKKMKEAGWKKETEFYWFYDKFLHRWRLVGYAAKAKRTGTFSAPLATEILEEFPKKFDVYEDFPIPLATEILEELPKKFDVIETKSHIDLLESRLVIEFNPTTSEWIVSYYGYIKHVWDKSLPDALAKMWLYLREKGLL